MSSENLPSKIEPANGRVTFAIDPKKHPLSRTLKKFEKNFDAALEVVLQVLSDPTVDTKTRLQAAQYIVDTKLEITKEISKEILGRQIAEVRMLQSMQPRTAKVVGEEDDAQPSAIFSPQTILKIDSQNV